MRRSRTEFAILGMLTHGPMSGYDLRGQLEERVSHFWAEGPGQIYPVLKRLVAEGHVTSRDQTRADGPRRIEYRITRSGRKHLREWLREPPARETVRNELMLKMFFGPSGDTSAAVQHIEAFERQQQALERQFAEFQERIEEEDVTELQKQFWRLTLRSGQLINAARLQWCREARAALSTESLGAETSAPAVVRKTVRSPKGRS